MHRYLDLLRRPVVRAHLLAALFGALPLGMAPLAVVLAVQGWTGSSALAGTATGLFSLGNGVGLLVLARLLGTTRPGAVTAASGAACAAALVALVVTGSSRGSPGEWSGASAAVLLAVCGLAGITVPPVTTAVRTWLPTVLTGDERPTAYALMSLVFQGSLVVGPVLVAGCALLLAPAAALGLTAAVAALAGGGHAMLARRHDRGGHPQELPCPPDGTSERSGSQHRARSLGQLGTVLAVAALLGAGAGHLVPVAGAGGVLTGGAALAVCAAAVVGRLTRSP